METFDMTPGTEETLGLHPGASYYTVLKKWPLEAYTHVDPNHLLALAVREAYAIVCQYWSDDRPVVLEQENRMTEFRAYIFPTIFFAIVDIIMGGVIIGLLLTSVERDVIIDCLYGFFSSIVVTGILAAVLARHHFKLERFMEEFQGTAYGPTQAHRDEFARLLIKSPEEARRFTQVQCIVHNSRFGGFSTVATPASFMTQFLFPWMMSKEAGDSTPFHPWATLPETISALREFAHANPVVQNISQTVAWDQQVSTLAAYLVERGAVEYTSNKNDARQYLRDKEGFVRPMLFSQYTLNGYSIDMCLPV